MILARCPSCATVFRATADQLKARQGMVRCGRCGMAFNALDAAVEPLAGPTTQESETQTAMALPPAPAEADGSVQTVEAAPVAPAAESEAPPPEPRLAPPAAGYKLPGRWRWPLLGWSAAALLAFALALGQTAYVFRSDFAQSYPSSRPLLDRFCAWFHCRIALPRQADLLSIESSDLQPDLQHREWLVLAATLKNRAGFAQNFPHLELTLTDARDQPLVRRVFPPGEYLNAAIDVSAGFAANAEQTVQLVLNAGDIGASGYRLYLFYP